MSVTFFIDGQPHGPSVNLKNANARTLLEWLGYAVVDLLGSLPPTWRPDAAGACGPRPGTRIWASRPDQRSLIPCGRRPGYLGEKAQEILALVEAAGPRSVLFA